MRKPWFQIIEVVEAGKRSLADIAKEVSARHRVGLREICSASQLPHVLAARDELVVKVKAERPDLSSRQVGGFVKRDPSTVRHTWRKMRAAA